MSSVILTGDTSGTLTVSAPLVAGSNTVTLPAATGTIGLLAQATAVASTSGTSIDFTGIPSWAKRITVMFSGVSTNGTTDILIQIGDSGGIETTGYVSSSSRIGSTVSTTSNTSGFALQTSAGGDIRSGHILLTKLSENLWIASATIKRDTATTVVMGGDKSLSDVLTQVRITTVNGTDTFDAGSINVMWEG